MIISDNPNSSDRDSYVTLMERTVRLEGPTAACFLFTLYPPSCPLPFLLSPMVSGDHPIIAQIMHSWY